MSGGDEDDKPTVVLDLNALKQKKQQQEDELANMASTLEFNVGQDSASEEKDLSGNVEDFLAPAATNFKPKFPIILFDFQSDFFKKSMTFFPAGFNYHVVDNLHDLNKFLKNKEFQLVIFNFDANPKAINQLTTQIKQKMPDTKTMIMARAISPDKAKLHASTPAGANAYYQLPLDPEKIEIELMKIYALKKAA